MADDWFRRTAWDDASREDFEARLARARPWKRPQYLRIKALALMDVGCLDAAEELLHRVLALPEEQVGFEAHFVHELLGDLAVRRGDPRSAERHYRRVLELDPTLNGTTGTVEIALAELLLDAGRRRDVREAGELLDSYMERDELKFDNSLFRWHLSLIRLAEIADDRETVRRAARTALELADRGPRLPRHKDVGLVRTDRATLRRLHRLAR